MRPEETVQAVELAPLAATPLKALRVEMPPRNEQTGIAPGALAEFRLEGSAPIGYPGAVLRSGEKLLGRIQQPIGQTQLSGQLRQVEHRTFRLPRHHLLTAQ